MAWTEKEIQSVWDKAERVSPENENVGFRKDQCGAWIQRSAYGKRNTKYGWEIDHIKPVAKGGGNELSNLRPLHWFTNASKQDDRLTKIITSKGEHNVYAETGEMF